MEHDRIEAPVWVISFIEDRDDVARVGYLKQISPGRFSITSNVALARKWNNPADAYCFMDSRQTMLYLTPGTPEVSRVA